MRRLGMNLKVATAMAALLLLLLPVLWAPQHTCGTRPIARQLCLGCLWVVLTTFLLPLAGTAMIWQAGRFPLMWQPARAAFRPRPPAVGRAPPFTLS